MLLLPMLGLGVSGACYTPAVSCSTADLKEGITEICTAAFNNCRELTGTLAIPDTVTKIGEVAFKDCTGLTKLTLGSGVTTIGAAAFNTCGFTGTLIIPGHVTKVGESAFYNNKKLTGVVLESTTEFGKGAFKECEDLTCFEGTLHPGERAVDIFPPGVEQCGSEVCFEPPTSCVLSTIPEGTTEICAGAWDNCGGMTGLLVFPDSVSVIGQKAFSRCQSLTGNLTLPKSLTRIGDHAFQDVHLTGPFPVLPEGLLSIGEAAFSGLSRVTGTVNIPKNVKVVGARAFQGCKGLDNVVVESGDTVFGEDVFADIQLDCYTGYEGLNATAADFLFGNITACPTATPIGSTAAPTATASSSAGKEASLVVLLGAFALHFF